MADQKPSSVSKSVTNLVIVGRTGTGKSSTGNTILGQRLFVSKLGAAGCTMQCEMYNATTEDGLIVNVIDTPGFFDMSVTTEFISRQVFKCLNLAEEGIHAMLFVLSVGGRISREEESTLNILDRVFGSKISDYIIVVFTGGDLLEKNDLTLDDYLYDGCPEFLTRLIRTCYGRKVLFDNKTRDKNKLAKQLKHLWAHVEDVRKLNRGKPFTNQMHLEIKVEDELKQSAIAHEREIRQLKDEFQKNQCQMVEIMLKQNAAAHEKEICQIREELEFQRQKIQQLQLLPQLGPVQCNIM